MALRSLDFAGVAPALRSAAPALGSIRDHTPFPQALHTSSRSAAWQDRVGRRTSIRLHRDPQGQRGGLPGVGAGAAARCRGGESSFHDDPHLARGARCRAGDGSSLSREGTGPTARQGSTLGPEDLPEAADHPGPVRRWHGRWPGQRRAARPGRAPGRCAARVPRSWRPPARAPAGAPGRDASRWRRARAVPSDNLRPSPAACPPAAPGLKEGGRPRSISSRSPGRASGCMEVHIWCSIGGPCVPLDRHARPRRPRRRREEQWRHVSAQAGHLWPAQPAHSSELPGAKVPVAAAKPVPELECADGPSKAKIAKFPAR